MPLYHLLTSLERELIELQRDSEEQNDAADYPERQPQAPADWRHCLQAEETRAQE